jgi:hypothetical protein
MTPAELKLYIDLGITATKMGIDTYNTLRSIWKTHGLSDEDINKIEAGIVADAEKRQSEREKMTGGGQ